MKKQYRLLRLGAVALFLVGSLFAGQTVSAQDTELSLQSKVPLGTVPEQAASLLRPLVNPEPANDVLQRTGVARLRPVLSSKDMVAEGTVTVYTPSGQRKFSVTLVQKGQHGSQLILLKQSDGKFWDGNVLHLEAGGRQALEFLETQHARGIRLLLGAPAREATIADNGTQNMLRSLTVKEKGGDSTQYTLDGSTSRITQFQFIRGTTRSSGGLLSPAVHSYAFTDVRTADGIATSFHVEHAVNGAKQEDLQLTKVNFSSPTLKVPAESTGPQK